LNVFPVASPPLRERSGDIPLLVRHFVQNFARRMKKSIDTIPKEALEALSRYSWPGNVRELENLIERSVILSRGSALEVPLSELAATAPEDGMRPASDVAAPAPLLSTIEATEREVIVKALEDSGWRVGGPKGAASRLGISRTTLQSKMQRLKISRPG
jgi:formate hydrogenlyase transcriptional activator